MFGIRRVHKIGRELYEAIAERNTYKRIVESAEGKVPAWAIEKLVSAEKRVAGLSYEVKMLELKIKIKDEIDEAR